MIASSWNEPVVLHDAEVDDAALLRGLSAAAASGTVRQIRVRLRREANEDAPIWAAKMDLVNSICDSAAFQGSPALTHTEGDEFRAHRAVLELGLDKADKSKPLPLVVVAPAFGIITPLVEAIEDLGLVVFVVCYSGMFNARTNGPELVKLTTRAGARGPVTVVDVSRTTFLPFRPELTDVFSLQHSFGRPLLGPKNADAVARFLHVFNGRHMNVRSLYRSEQDFMASAAKGGVAEADAKRAFDAFVQRRKDMENGPFMTWLCEDGADQKILRKMAGRKANMCYASGGPMCDWLLLLAVFTPSAKGPVVTRRGRLEVEMEKTTDSSGKEVERPSGTRVVDDEAGHVVVPKLDCDKWEPAAVVSFLAEFYSALFAPALAPSPESAALACRGG